MIVIPSIKLRDGRARATTPTSAARELGDMGFSRLHLSNGFSVTGSEGPVLEEVLRITDASVQVGGVEATSEIEQLIRLGVDSVVVGDRGIEEPDWLADVADLYPEAIGATTAVRDRRVVRRGWVRTLPVDILDLVDELNAIPLQALVVTTPALDAATRFAELSLLEDVAERSRFPVFISGDIAEVNDLRALEHRGIAGAILDADSLLAGVLDGRSVAREFGA